MADAQDKPGTYRYAAAFRVSREAMRVLESWTPSRSYDCGTKRLELRFTTQSQRDSAVESIGAVDHIPVLEIFELNQEP